MMRQLRGYMKTIRQYAASPKMQYEYKHYARWLVLYLFVVGMIWGGIYIYHGNY